MTYLVYWHLFALSSLISDDLLCLFSVVWRSDRRLALLMLCWLSIEIERTHIGLVLLRLLRLGLLRLSLILLRLGLCRWRLG